MQPLEKNRSSQNRLERVLVIDDDPIFLRLYRHLLSAHLQSHELVECADGYTALTRMLERTPRLVLLDLTMPRFDGLGFLAIVKSKPELSSLPILVISSDADEAHARIGELANVRWFAKPIRLTTLQRILDEELGMPVRRIDDAPCAQRDAQTVCFDTAGFDYHVGCDHLMQVTIAHQFCALSAERLAMLERLVVTRERPGLRTLAHVLEGSAATLGAVSLLAACRRLRCSLDADSEDSRIRQETIAVAEALRRFTVTLAQHFELTDF